MKKIIIPILLSAMLLSPAILHANYIGVGLHVGTQYNVGNLNEYSNSIQYDPQINAIVGFSAKFDLKFFFIRPGVDLSFKMIDGKVLNSSSVIEKTKITYYAAPCFIGLNLPVKEIGTFYLGGGAAYMIAAGSIKLASVATATEISNTGWGYGFISGINMSINNKLGLYMEWQYLEYMTDPIVQTGSHTWKDLAIDYSGHRISVGVIYYLL